MFPSARRLLRQHLADTLDIPVHINVPNPRPERFIRVLNAGGEGQVNPALEDVALTIETWGDDVWAEDTANGLWAMLRFAPSWAGSPVYHPRLWAPPVDLPDESGVTRFTFTMSVNIRFNE